MKTNFPQRADRTRTQARKRWAGGLLLAVLLLVLLQVGALRPVEALLQRVAQPLWSTGNSAAAQVHDLSAVFASKTALRERADRLSHRVERLERRLKRLAVLEEENRRLKALLGRAQQERDTVLAAVLARPYASPYGSMVIDTGRAEGVEAGDLVMARGGIVVGDVTDVYAQSAKVSLFSAPGRTTEVEILPASIFAVAEGRGGGNFSVTLPKGADVQEGNAVVIPGINPDMFAVVEEVRSKSADPEQTVLFKNPVNVAQLRWVEVVRGTFAE